MQLPPFAHKKRHTWFKLAICEVSLFVLHGWTVLDLPFSSLIHQNNPLMKINIFSRWFNLVMLTLMYKISEKPISSAWPNELKLQEIEKKSESSEEYYEDDDWDEEEYEDDDDWLDDEDDDDTFDDDEYDDEYYDDDIEVMWDCNKRRRFHVLGTNLCFLARFLSYPRRHHSRIISFREQYQLGLLLVFPSWKWHSLLSFSVSFTIRRARHLILE